MRGNEDFFQINEETYVGVSGGKTSGLLAFLMEAHNKTNLPIVYMFANTGREHTNTLKFVVDLKDAFETPFLWIEYRKPPNKYGAPCESIYEIIETPEQFSRNGEPFEMFLEALAEYREFEKGKGPLAPIPTMRICTAYMKAKTMEHYTRRELGWDCFTKLMGLRADEPARVAKMSDRDTKKITTDAPLARAGLTKEDVNRFWSEQPFTLELPENLGNCTLCFLKDEADLAFNMLYEIKPAETQWWIDMQKKYGAFKVKGASYEEIWKEAPVRFAIRDALQQEREPVCPEGFDAYRFKLLIRQERRVLKEGLVRIPCSCEQAELMTDEYILEQ